jgi:peptidoglycan/LPS O-acetylase OafA/YrhL
LADAAIVLICLESREVINVARKTGSLTVRSASRGSPPTATSYGVSHRALGTETVDGLRGIAVLLVFLYHTWIFSLLDPSLRVFGITLPTGMMVRAGYLGVDIFFIISGFCLYLPYARAEYFKRASPDTKTFYLRRMLKIVPSYIIAISVTALLTMWVLPSQMPVILIDTIQHLLFVQNLVPPLLLGNANFVLWSVAVEVQFYLIFPLLVNALRRGFWTGITMLVLASFAYRTLLTPCCVTHEDLRELPSYLDLFAFGIVAARLQVMLSAMSKIETFQAPFTAGSVILFLCGMALFSSADSSMQVHNGPALWSAGMRGVFGLTIAMLLILSCGAHAHLKRFFANRLLVGLSIISYNVYLWHTIIEIFLSRNHIIPSATPNPQDDPMWKLAFYACSIAGTLIVASAITYFIERPILSRLTPQSSEKPGS